MVIATLYKRSEYERGFDGSDCRTFGTERAAELWAEAALEPVVTTYDCYHRDMGRASYVRLEYGGAPIVRKVREESGECYVSRVRSRIIEPRCIMVPSVGELGYTP